MPETGDEVQITTDDTRTSEECRAILEHRERQIEAIRRVSDALFSHPSVEAMVRETLKIALDVLRADAGTVFLHDEDDDTLVFRYVIGGAGEKLIGQKIPANRGVAGTVFQSEKSVLVGDVTTRADFHRDVDDRSGYHTESMMTVPVKRTNGKAIGVMQVLNAHLPPFTGHDLEVLEILCAQAATGIEHARLVEAARKAEVVSLIGDISHDIKNMMTPILSGAWTLGPMFDRFFLNLDEMKAKYPEEIASELTTLADMVRHDYGWMLQNSVHAAEQAQARTREIADAMKGEMSPPYFELGDLNETCRLVSATLKIVATNRQVALLLDLDDTLPTVEYDRKQVYNALYNLVNNALPETPAGGTVTLRTARSLEEEIVLVQVEDTGRGIPEHIRVRLFTNQAVSTKKGGTGLGTRIVAGVVQRHNGTIAVESKEGSGSTFTIRIPLRHQN